MRSEKLVKIGKGTHYHSEEKYWLKSKINNQERKSYIKHVNNSGVETELIDTDTKKLKVTPIIKLKLLLDGK